MNTKPTLPRRRVASTLACAALAVLIGVGLLDAVAGLMRRDGTPFEQVVVAERACAASAYASERASCLRARLAPEPMRRLASR